MTGILPGHSFCVVNHYENSPAIFFKNKEEETQTHIPKEKRPLPRIHSIISPITSWPVSFWLSGA